MSLLPLFEWLEQTGVGMAIASSSPLRAGIEIVHLLGMGATVGSVIVVNLSLLGIGMRRQPIGRVSEQLTSVTKVGLGVSLPTGLLLLSSMAVSYYGNSVFWVKMALLGSALTVQFTLHRKAIRDRSPRAPLWAKLVACLSLVLWISIGLAGKWIGFVQ